MPSPHWLAYGFAALTAVVSVYCIARIAAARPMKCRNHYDINAAHALMGIAMVGMFVPRWNEIPDGIWEVVFGIVALWFLGLGVRLVARQGWKGTHEDHGHGFWEFMVHMVMACVMDYMYWLGMPASGSSGASMSMSGPPAGAGDPGLTLALIVVLFASAIWQLDSIDSVRFDERELAASGDTVVRVGSGGSGSGARGGAGVLPEGPDDPWLAPRLEVCCHIAMCLAMGYMLILVV